jgi:hypothetical protein
LAIGTASLISVHLGQPEGHWESTAWADSVYGQRLLLSLRAPDAARLCKRVQPAAPTGLPVPSSPLVHSPSSSRESTLEARAGCSSEPEVRRTPSETAAWSYQQARRALTLAVRRSELSDAKSRRDRRTLGVIRGSLRGGWGGEALAHCVAIDAERVDQLGGGIWLL